MVNISYLVIFLIYVCSTSAKQVALLVGVCDYAPYGDKSDSDLTGPKNDVAKMRSLLIAKFGFKAEDIITLEDADATTKNIVGIFKNHLIEGIGEDDSAVFYFSGHGTQVRDLDGDEQDGMDEVICSSDFDSSKPQTQLTDDVMHALLRKIPTPNAWIVFDCCHSGTGSRSLFPASAGNVSSTMRYLPSGFRPLDAEKLGRATEQQKSLLTSAELAEIGRKLKAGSGFTRAAHSNASHVFMSAAQADQVAWESSGSGIFTDLLVTTLSEDPDASFEAVFAKIRPVVLRQSKAIFESVGRGTIQEPTCEGKNQKLGASKLLTNPSNETGSTEPLSPVSPGGEGAPPAGETIPSLDEIIPGYRPQGEIEVSLKANKSVFADGERLKLEVSVSEDCYLRIYYFSAANEVLQIFPNKFQSANHINKGAVVQLPPLDASFSFELGKPFGNEVIKAVVCSRQFTDLENQQTQEALFTQFADSSLNSSSNRGINVTGKSTKPRWGENIIIYRVEEK